MYNNIFWTVIIIVIIGSVFLVKKPKRKEKFSELTYTDDNMPLSLKESSSINSTDVSNFSTVDSNGKSTVYGNFISKRESINLTTGLIIDDTNVDYLNDKVINITKPVTVKITNMYTTQFPIRIYFYNSTSANLDISLSYIYTDSKKRTIVSWAKYTCVSNRNTNNVNKLSLTIDSSNTLQSSVLLQNDYLWTGVEVCYSYKGSLRKGTISALINNYIKSNDVKTVFFPKINNSQFLTISTSPAPAPTSK